MNILETEYPVNPYALSCLESALVSGYIPHEPFDLQTKVLLLDVEDMLIGGAAGGSKSESALMLGLQYVNEPNYHGLIIRRTYRDLKGANSLLDRCEHWLSRHIKDGVVHYDRIDKRFTFPSGSTLDFGYLSNDSDLMNYQGSEYQTIIIDEASQLPEKHIRYMHSRLRKTTENDVPLRFILASNPGAVSNDFLRDTYVEGPKAFIPMTYRDNPYINNDEYEKQLNYLPEVTRRQLMNGEWNVYDGSWLLVTHEEYENCLQPLPDDKLLFSVVGVDSASTGQDKFACTLISLYQTGLMWLSDMVATRKMNQEEILFTFLEQHQDKNIKLIAFEREPGSDSTFAKKYWQGLLPEYNVVDFSPQGSKFVRARPVGKSIREKRLFINKDIEESLINELRNQFGYIHPLKEKMKEYPSPDLLDSTDYAHMGVMKILENKTRVTIL